MARIRRSKTNTTFFMDIPKSSTGQRYRRTEDEDWFKHKKKEEILNE